MEYLKYTINEDEWVFYLAEDDDNDLTDGQAEVLFSEKEVYIKKGSLKLSVVKHELWHIYVKYCYLDDASIEQFQFEEITATLFEDKGEKIIERSKDIYKKLKALRDTVPVKENKTSD